MMTRKTILASDKFELIYDCEDFQYCIIELTNPAMKLWQQVGKWYYTKSYAVKKYYSYLNN